jgi:hypothetical protein
MQPAFELLPDVFELADVKRRVKIQDVDFDEDFLSELISNYFKVAEYKNRPTISTAFEIYMRETLQLKGVDLSIQLITTTTLFMKYLAMSR